MARPPRTNVDYFPHFANHKKEILYLRRIYGNEGYAIYYLLFEKIALAQNHYLNLQDETEIDYLASELLIEEHTLLLIIEHLIKLKIFDVNIWQEFNVLFSESFNDTIEDAYKRRSNNLITKTELIVLLESNGIHKLSIEGVLDDIILLNDDIKPQSKEEKNKVDNTKLKKNKEEVEESKEEANKINITLLFKKYYSNKDWVKNIISNRSYRIQNELNVLSRLQQFEDYLLCLGIKEKEEKDFIKHFNSWLNKVKMTPFQKIRIRTNENKNEKGK